MATSKKRRARAQTSKAPKRSRISKARASKALKDKALPFPAAILALPHVLELIDTFRMTPEEAARHAAATGQSEWLERLISSYGSVVANQDMLVDAAAKGYDEIVKKLVYMLSYEVLPPAVEAAGANGKYTTLKILLPELSTLSTEEVGKSVGKVLDEAAERGCLDAVMAIVNDTDTQFAVAIAKNSKALSRAAAGGHTDVIEFLLKLNHPWKWDPPHAVAAAVEKKQTAIAMKISSENPRYQGKNLFVCLARDGHTGAVEFFFPNVSSNVELLSQALLEAAKSDQSGVVEFLLATKRIPSDLTKRAFVAAAGHGASAVVQYLIETNQVSSETIHEGFLSASAGRHLSLVQWLCTEQQISAEFVLEAFKKTWSTWTKLQKYLVEVLTDESCIPEEFMFKAFVDAALTGKSTALKYLAWRELPMSVLKEAYATRRESSKAIVGAITCEQVFRPNYMSRFN